MKKYYCDMLSLMTNYVEHKIAEGNTCDVISILQTVRDASIHEFTDEEKAQMHHDTVMALNCGSDEAMECAFEIRLKALCSDDEEFIKKIEYLHEVL